MSNMLEASLSPAGGTFRIGDAFTRTFGAFGRHFVTFVVLAIIAYIPGFIFNYLVPQRLMSPEQTDFWTAMRWIAISITVDLFCSSLTCGMVVYGVMQALRGRSFTIEDCLRKAFTRLLPLLGVAICVGIATIAASLAFVIPGVIVAMMYYLAQPVCVVEKNGVFDSMSRSAALTKGFRWQIFAITFIVGIGAFILRFVQTYIFSSLGSGALSMSGVGVEVLIDAFSATLAGVVYYLLRVEKEGVDIEQIASVFE